MHVRTSFERKTVALARSCGMVPPHVVTFKVLCNGQQITFVSDRQEITKLIRRAYIHIREVVGCDRIYSAVHPVLIDLLERDTEKVVDTEEWQWRRSSVQGWIQYGVVPSSMAYRTMYYYPRSIRTSQSRARDAQSHTKCSW